MAHGPPRRSRTRLAPRPGPVRQAGRDVDGRHRRHPRDGQGAGPPHAQRHAGLPDRVRRPRTRRSRTSGTSSRRRRCAKSSPARTPSSCSTSSTPAQGRPRADPGPLPDRERRLQKVTADLKEEEVDEPEKKAEEILDKAAKRYEELLEAAVLGGPGRADRRPRRSRPTATTRRARPSSARAKGIDGQAKEP